MGRWMTTLTRRPELLGLNESVLREMFTTGSPLGPAFFAQGTLTSPTAGLPLGTPWVFYVGNSECGSVGSRALGFRSLPCLALRLLLGAMALSLACLSLVGLF